MGISTFTSKEFIFFFCRVSKIGNGWYRRWTMKSNPCCIVVNPRTPKFQCCLWAARLSPVDKQTKPWTQRKLDRVLCNIEIWGVGFYLVDVCGVCFFCPSTVGWLVVIVVFLLVSDVLCSYFKIVVEEINMSLHESPKCCFLLVGIYISDNRWK